MLDTLGIFKARLWLDSRRSVATRLPMLTYHSLGTTGSDYLFDAGVIDASAQLFDRQMAYIAGLYAPITSEDLRAAQRGAPLPSNPIAITFDDGYRSNLEVAVPILKRHGLRATFFIATSYVTERRLFWWDRISYLLKRSTRERIELSYPRELRFDLRRTGSGAATADGVRDAVRDGVRDAIEQLLELVKRTNGLDLDRLLDELTLASGVPWSRDIERAMADELILTWDGVRALRAAGMDVQSHTCTHRVLTTLAPDAVRAELVESRAVLERELGTPVRAVSYPCGYPIANQPALCEAVLRAGYELGFASAGRTSSLRDGRTDPLNLRRLLTDYDMPMSWFRGMLAFPQLVHG